MAFGEYNLDYPELDPSDLIVELNAAAVKRLLAMKRHDVLKGKFVRLGKVPVVSATYRYEHVVVGRHGLNCIDPDVRQRILNTAPKDETDRYLQGEWPMVDAGRFSLSYNTTTNTTTRLPTGLRLYDTSFEFGPPSEATRSETGEIVQEALKALGKDFVVTVDI